jgi:hypothetical protein
VTTSLYPRMLGIPVNALIEDESFDTVTARAVASNLSRLADQSAQVLAAWTHSTLRLTVPLSTAGITNYQLLWGSTAFPVRRRTDGQPYRLRVAIRASHGGSGNVEFTALVVPGAWGNDFLTYFRNVNAGRVSENARATATIASGSAAWLTLNRTWVQLQPYGGADARRGGYATRDIIGSGGVTEQARFDIQRILVFARTATGSGGNANLFGVYAAEFVGP